MLATSITVSVGQLVPAIKLLCRINGEPNQPLDLTGLLGTNIAVHILPVPSGNVVVGGGVSTILDAKNGIVQYQQVAGDFATPGNFTMKVIVTFPGGPDMSAPIPLTVEAA